MKFINQTARQYHTLVDTRGFFDTEFPVSEDVVARAVEVQRKADELQKYLSKAYSLLRGGASIDNLELPECLKDDKPAPKRARRASGASSNKKSQKTVTNTGSPTSTNQKDQ